MQTPLTHRSLGLVMLVVGMTALTSMGCRSTRSGLSQLPGMAWVAPDDEELYGSWSEDGEPKLPTPSQGATPQLTTKSGTSSLNATSDTPDASTKTKQPSTDNVTRSSTAYPDTGYPVLQQPNTLGSRGSTESPRSLVGKSGKFPSSQTAGGIDAPRAQPQRGFYGDTYEASGGGRYADTAGPAEDLPSPGRYSDAEPQPSRYSDPATDDSRYGNGDNPNRADFAGPGPDSHQPLVSDSENGYDPTGGQSGADFPESGSGAPYADDLSDPSGRPQGVADTTRQIAEEIREDYQRTSDELRNRLKQGANTVSDSTRELTNNVQDLARQAGDQVERSAAEMTEGIRDGYSRYSNPSSDPASDLPSDLSHDAASSTTIPASDHASALPSDRGREPSRATRSSQPWRPGSTGTYPAGDLDQSRYPSTGAPSEIEPASYPETIGSESRFAPAYR